MTRLLEVVASVTLVCFWGQNLVICPHWLHWKQSPLWILCLLSLSIIVALALVRPMSMALGLLLLSAFLHCIQVAPPCQSPPLTLSLRNIYSCWCVHAAWVQSFHVTGWSNLIQLDTNLYGSPRWNMSRVASSSKLYPAFFAIDWNCDMNVSRLSPFIRRSLMFCWAFTFSTVLVYAWWNLVSMVAHRFSLACATPPWTCPISHCACSLTQSFTRGPLMYY